MAWTTVDADPQPGEAGYYDWHDRVAKGHNDLKGALDAGSDGDLLSIDASNEPKRIASGTYNKKLRVVADVVEDHGAVGDGVTDDTNAINEAIDTVAAAGGGIVFFPTGTYAVSTDNTTNRWAVEIESKVSLVGVGKEASKIVNLNGNLDGNLLYGSNVRYFSISHLGFEITQATMSSTSNNIDRLVEIRNSPDHFSIFDCRFVEGNATQQVVIIEGSDIEYYGNQHVNPNLVNNINGASFVRCSRVTVFGNTLNDITDTNIFFEDCVSCTAVANIIDGETLTAGIDFFGSQYCTASGNFVKMKDRGRGIAVRDPVQNLTSHSCTVTGNVVRDAWYGIDVSDRGRATVDTNIVYSCERVGIFVRGGAGINNIVMGNVVYDNGGEAGEPETGISVGTNKSIVVGNTAFDTGALVQQVGIAVTGTQCVMHGNVATDNVTTNIDATWADGESYLGNIGSDVNVLDGGDL